MPLKALLGCIAMSLLISCATEGTVIVGPRHSAPHHQVDIPPGHMPPPGKCRIWFPDRPPGQQPPPGECNELRQRVPPDATLIRG